ncbi:MAG: glucosaminidase domain-containing protein [Solobacterium sp.]|nr:glucosaminidase domain-containing protein [Solobacterium sp.]
MKNIWIKLLTAGLMGASGIHPENTSGTGSFMLKDYAAGEQEIASFSAYSEAYAAFAAQKDSYGNLCITWEDKVLAAEYAAVLIPSSDACDYNLVYRGSDGRQGYINGCYGKDAWYISTSADGSTVTFAISGAEATASSEEVTIVPLENIPVTLTSYTVNDGMLYHRLRTSMNSDLFSSRVLLDEAPSYLQEDSVYFSADGHWFYANEKDLLDDLKEGGHGRAVNTEPWYCYYQYLSHRSITELLPSGMQKWLEETNGINGPMTQYLDNDGDSVCDILNRSQYWGTVDAFYQYQYQYGANALLMLALSCNESARGRSSLAFTRNNLFGHSAYDTSVEESASRYMSPANSIYSHARYYLSRSYCNPYWVNYRGAYFGNKASGMNVNYASDPYWGEKAAAYCGMIARASGSADHGSQTILICRPGEIPVYRDAACTDVLYRAGVEKDYAAIVLEELPDAWHIQSDLHVGRDDADYAYDFASDTGYLSKSDVLYVIGGTSAAEHETVRVWFDAAGGSFADGSTSISYAMYRGTDAACTEPVKEGMLFTGWDQSTSAVDGDTVFTAQYETIHSIAMDTMPETEYHPGETISLYNGTVKLETDNGEIIRPLNTSMVSGFDMNTAGTQTVQVQCSGARTSYEIHVAVPDKAAAEAVDLQRVYDVMYMFNSKTLRSSEAGILLELKKDMDENGIPALTMVQRMKLDTLLRRAVGDHAAYVLDSDWKEAGVSGLAIAMPLSQPLTGNLLSRSVYSVRLENTENDTALVRIAEMTGNVPQCSVTVTVMADGKPVKEYEPLVISIPKPDDSMSYRVFRMGHGQDILECRTVETEHAVRFIASENGTYLISGRSGSTQELSEDITESLTVKNSSFTSWPLVIIAGAAGLFVILAGIIALSIRGRRRRRRRDHKNSRSR